MKKIVALAAALALVAGTAQAQTASCFAVGSGTQSCSANTVVQVSVPTILKVVVTDSVTSFSAPSDVDFDAGYKDYAAAVSVDVKSNATNTLTIAAGAANWTAPGSVTKASTDLLWKTGAGTLAGLSTSAANVGSGGKGTDTYTIDYRVLWDYANDEPGNYSLPVIFSATAP